MRRIRSFDGHKVADHLVPTTRVGITQYGKPNFSYQRSFHARQMMPAHCCATYFLHSDQSLTSRSMISRSSAHVFGRYSRRASSAVLRNTSGPAGGSSSAPSSGRNRTRSSSQGHNALTGRRQGAEGQHAHNRGRIRPADAHDPRSDRGIDRSRPRWSDELRLDRSVAHLSRVARRTLCHRGGGRGDPVRKGRIAGVAVRQRGKRTVVAGDHYVAALPSSALPRW